MPKMSYSIVLLEIYITNIITSRIAYTDCHLDEAQISFLYIYMTVYKAKLQVAYINVLLILRHIQDRSIPRLQ